MNDMSKLKHLGYNQFFEEGRVELGADIDQLARVVIEHKGAYDVANADGEYRATVTGKRMLIASGRDDYPAVGDWVVLKNNDDDSKVIDDILPRKTTLRKKYGGRDEAQLMVTNVDVAFIVESMDRDYNLNRFERYLVLAHEGGVHPVVVLNKSDLISETDLSTRIAEIHERFGGIDVLSTSAVTDAGQKSLLDYIKKGVTYCFLGSSGVGKSSLINRLLTQELIATKDIGRKTGRGKHTTTAREMYFTDAGGIIIDNPGSREVGVVDSEAGIKEVFTDIEELSLECKFTDCNHTDEPDCAVVGALKAGLIDESHYENFQKLQKETEHYEMSLYDKRQKNKQFGKMIKNAKTTVKKDHPQ